MVTMTQDTAIALHIGRLSVMKDMMTETRERYEKILNGRTYRMRAEDIKRVEGYLKDINIQYKGLQTVLKSFKELV